MSQRVARGGMYLLAGSQLHEAADKSRIPDPVQFYIYRRRWCAQGRRRRHGRAPLPLLPLAAAFTVFLFRSFSARPHLSAR